MTKVKAKLEVAQLENRLARESHPQYYYGGVVGVKVGSSGKKSVGIGVSVDVGDGKGVAVGV